MDEGPETGPGSRMRAQRSSTRATLFVVATPIGNLGDVTLRAIEVLGSCAVIAAEDTRRTRVLLDRHGVGVRTLALHKFNEERATVQLLEVLEGGGDVGYVTDGGTPGVSDPGARLVARVRESGHPVVPVPGPSAPAAAISVSGWEGPWSFEGYVERRPEARRRQIDRAVNEGRAVVMFESPERLKATLGTIARAAPTCGVVVAREMTKLYEEITVASAEDHLARLPDRVRGEITLVLLPSPGGPGPRGRRSSAGSLPGPGARSAGAPLEAVRKLVALGVRVKDATKIVAELCGLGARDLYEQAVRSTGDGTDP